MPGRSGQEHIVAPATINQIFQELGEVKAVSREAKHAANGASQKIDGLSAKVDQLAIVVATQGQIREHVQRLEEEAKEDRAEILALKADKLRREGAIGLVEWLARHWPATILILALAACITWANGKLHP
jgi:hypothetical protein